MGQRLFNLQLRVAGCALSSHFLALSLVGSPFLGAVVPWVAQSEFGWAIGLGLACCKGDENFSPGFAPARVRARLSFHQSLQRTSHGQDTLR
jgi:hypothetical protein